MKLQKKYKVMKRYIAGFLIALGLLVSCEDYLEFPPEGEVYFDDKFER